ASCTSHSSSARQSTTTSTLTTPSSATTTTGPVVAPGAEVPGSAIRAFSFVGPAVGFGVTAVPQLVESNDGGSTWRARGGRIPLSISANPRLAFASATTGFVYDEDIVVTHDRGETWSAI